MVVNGLFSLVHSFGRLDGATAFADREARPLAALATIADAWTAYRRDAGSGDVGVAHAGTIDDETVLLTADPRRDAVLLWLADSAFPTVAASAATLVCMVEAKQRFPPEDMALLDTACAAFSAARTDGALARAFGLADLEPDHLLQRLVPVIGAIDILIDDPDFAEISGRRAKVNGPNGVLHHDMSAQPAGCWALNLGLLGHKHPLPSLPGPIPRAAFRRELTANERAVAITEHWAQTAEASFKRRCDLVRHYADGLAALAGRSRNARVRDAWGTLIALGALRRVHLARALGLSRAGADIQANALAQAGLVTLSFGGFIRPSQRNEASAAPPPLAMGPLALAIADVDARLAEVTHLLDRTSRV